MRMHHRLKNGPSRELIAEAKRQEIRERLEHATKVARELLARPEFFCTSIQHNVGSPTAKAQQ